MKAKKHLGQHFLTDLFILSEIICAIQPKKTENILEIGPGYGALTKMLAPLVDKLSVIEIDQDCLETLNKFDNLIIHHQDVLEFDWSKIKPKSRIVGNLPYNIATEIFFKCLHAKDNILDMHFMMQKEVASRLIANPGTKAYGKLTVMMQTQASVEVLFDIPPQAFDPMPKVMSSFCRIEPKRTISCNKKLLLLEKIVTAAFSRRRKQCHHNLKPWFKKSDLESLDISPNLRAEDITVEQYESMVDNLL